MSFSDRLLSQAKSLFYAKPVEFSPEWRPWLTQSDWSAVLADPGYSHHQSFFQELIYRLNEIFLPERPPEKDLRSLLFHLSWLTRWQEKLDGPLRQNLERLAPEICAANNPQFKSGLRRAYDMISSHFVSAALVLGDEEGEKVRSLDPARNPDFDWDSVEDSLNHALTRLRHSGITLDQVFLIEIQRRRLRRMRYLHKLFDPHLTAHASAEVMARLTWDLLEDAQERRKIFKFLKKNLRLTTQRIVEANSTHGEHYLIRNWKEYREILFGAAGGGLCTAITVLIKQILSYLPFATFSKGLAESINYSLSFLAIAYFGFFLATKQPSATAPYLAASIKKKTVEWRSALFSLLRAQTVSVFGNVIVVIPICLLFSRAMLLLGHPLQTPLQAQKSIAMANPFGFLPLFAAFTGVLLFLASLMGGWFENWTQLHSLPERIRGNPKLRRRLGEKLCERIANAVGNHANALGASVSLGFLLGMAPQVLQFLNFPIEPRHVTLTSGIVSLAIPNLPGELVTAHLIFSLIGGVALIAALNISVSFILALSLASLSVDLEPVQTLKRVGRGALAFLVRPWNLFIPEKKPEPTE